MKNAEDLMLSMHNDIFDLLYNSDLPDELKEQSRKILVELSALRIDLLEITDVDTFNRYYNSDTEFEENEDFKDSEDDLSLECRVINPLS